MTAETTTKTHRRVITGHRSGKAVILSDERRPAYGFKTVAGFEQTYIWAAESPVETDPAIVEPRLPKSALPSPGGSLVQIATFPPAAAASSQSSDPMAIVQEYLTRMPGLAETFEPDGMHATRSLDYAILLEGELWLEVDDGESVKLTGGDIVVQQATRHAWRNKSDQPATIAFIMLGAST